MTDREKWERLREIVTIRVDEAHGNMKSVPAAGDSLPEWQRFRDRFGAMCEVLDAMDSLDKQGEQDNGK